MRTFEILESFGDSKNFKSSHPNKTDGKDYTTKNIKFQLTKRKPKRTNKIFVGKSLHHEIAKLWLLYYIQAVRRK